MLINKDRPKKTQHFNNRFIRHKFITEKEAADIYGICTKTLSYLRKKGKLQVNKHYFYVGNQILFFFSKLQDYFKLESERKLQPQ
jgi:hypothetical protein